MADEGGEGGEVVDIPDRLIVWDVMRPGPRSAVRIRATIDVAVPRGARPEGLHADQRDPKELVVWLARYAHVDVIASPTPPRGQEDNTYKRRHFMHAGEDASPDWAGELGL